jgi:hypothetical protein
MKCNNLALILITLFAMSACVKTKTSEAKVPEFKKSEPIVIKKSGYRCDMAGINENNKSESKEIFIQLDKKDNTVKVKFNDFTSGDRISVIFGSFDGYKLLGFDMEDENNELVGESVLLHDDMSSLSLDGKVISGTVKLTLDKDLNGKMERKLLISKEDSSLTSTEFEDVAEISNCEKLEAIWM